MRTTIRQAKDPLLIKNIHTRGPGTITALGNPSLLSVRLTRLTTNPRMPHSLHPFLKLSNLLTKQVWGRPGGTIRPYYNNIMGLGQHCNILLNHGCSYSLSTSITDNTCSPSGDQTHLKMQITNSVKNLVATKHQNKHCSSPPYDRLSTHLQWQFTNRRKHRRSSNSIPWGKDGSGDVLPLRDGDGSL